MPLLALWCTVAVALVAGCQNTGHRGPEGPPPEYAALAEKYNARLAQVPRLWARAVTQATYPGKDGKPESIQAEGHFQFIPPRSLLWTFDKVGLQKTFAVLGSNDTRYWWIDLMQDRVMSIGTHERATPAVISRLGLPMYPLALLDVAGLTPLPDPALPDAPEVAWSGDGLAVVTIKEDGRPVRRVFLSPGDAMPRRVELLGQDGGVTASAEISMPREVKVPFPATGPLFPTRYVIDADDEAGHVNVRIELFAMDTTRKQPQAEQFDPAVLAERLGVERVVDLDEAGNR
ncbi:MAG: hypothetical protein IT437_10865 [Phycisphaerales bacterium]|nr:hypothetical protein [Phycisphaerales bacterium]